MKKIKKILITILFVLSIFNLALPYVVNASDKIYANETLKDNEGGSTDTKKSTSMDINNEGLTCRQILGENLRNVVKAGITVFQIACIIISLIRGMTILIPALLDKNADKDHKKTGELVVLLIVLVVALLFKPILSLLGKALDFDVSCIL